MATSGSSGTNLSVELCDPWVIPYIGDLVATTPLFDESRVRQPDTAGELFVDLRGHVSFPTSPSCAGRRRQDDLLSPPQRHAADARGVGARRDRMGRARRGVLRASRLDAVGAQPPALHIAARSDFRSVERMDRINGPFDDFTHTVDVRQIRRSTAGTTSGTSASSCGGSQLEMSCRRAPARRRR